MSVLEFISSLVRSLAWPLFFVLLIIIFLKQFRQILNTIKYFKFGGVEVQIADRLKAVRRDSEILSLQPDTRLERIAEISPILAIKDAWDKFELIVQEKIRELNIVRPDRMQMNELFSLLKTNGLISDDEMGMLINLRSIRNALVHKPSYKVSGEEAVNYANLIHSIANKIEDFKK
jgi:uncharacterized protein YutE (UPF0331/DUF86 family)